MFIYWKVVINAKNTIYKVLMIPFIKCLCEALFESLIKLLKKEISPTINISSHRSLWNIMLIVLYWRPNPQGKRKDMKMEHHFIHLTIFTWYIAFFLRCSYDFCSICQCGIYHTDLGISKNPCIPGINPTWLCCMIPSVFCWFQIVTDLLKIFH